MSTKKPTKEEVEKHNRALEAATHVELLLQFSGSLIPFLDLLKETYEGAGNQVSLTDAMAPIIGAFGEDYEAISFEKKLKARRAKALYELVKVLSETEKEREEFAEKRERNKEGRAQLAKLLGGL